MSKKMFKILPVLLFLLILVVQPIAAQDNVLKIWYYEQGNAIGDSWDFARDQFTAMHPDVTIEFELKTFDQIQQTAQMVLNTEDVPDVMEVNKGNATAGLYSSLGLLTDLSDVAAEKGWTDILSPSILTTSRYNANGIMGDGPVYGVTTYGEFVMVYYNKDMFAERGIEVPTTYDEYTAILDSFVAEGITPLSVGAQSVWPVTQNWYELALYKANRDWINNFQLLQGDLDFHDEAFTYGSEELLNQFTKGYYGDNANGIIYDDANAAFIQGTVPMTLTGSWMFGAFREQITNFDWGIFILPGKDYNTGSGGNLWVVPTNAKNKDLAYEFIDLTLQPEAQTVMANAGGIPVNADLSQIEDSNILELNTAFATIVANDGLAFYPDWPIPGFMDILGGGLQSLISSAMNPSDFLDSIAAPYNDYKASLQ